MAIKVSVYHWRYETGWREMPDYLVDETSPVTNTGWYDDDLKGWHCWVYADDWKEFEDWMEKNMSGYFSCDRKFNSGDPMQLVHIKEDADASLFKLTWNPKPDRFRAAGLI
jgi:hypothetical protein